MDQELHFNGETTMKKELIWEKWYDPFGMDHENAEFPGAFGDFTTDKLVKKAKNHISASGYEPEDENITNDDVERAMKEFHRQGIAGEKRYNIMVTPMGLIPLTEHSRASNLFDFWIGHTNFPITKSTIKELDKIPGIESLDVFTTYRFRISIGRAFQSAQVKDRITKTLCGDSSSDEQENPAGPTTFSD